MNTKPAYGGVLVPAITPVTSDLAPDRDAFVDHCKWLLSEGATGLAIFGTTSEANSFSGEERRALLDHLVDSGVPADVLMPGTGACSITESVELTRHALSRGVTRTLMLPPFYYKGVSDDGLFRFYSEVIQRVGDDRLNLYLYHIPPMSQVPLSLDLVERLINAFPKTVVGLKDSSGDWSNTKALIERFPGFQVFPGSEVFMLDALRIGGVGCITATGNVNIKGISALYRAWETDQADAMNETMVTVRKTIQAYPMVPALKFILSRFHRKESLATVRPPLVPLADDKGSALLADLEKLNFKL
ncbi:dihydrodipicolinate synthase family protein [Fodinicurvata sp. EGI_FJ10296]|uniref:dihydrodipicolinate synthase family protein n=1 Tax=Fodinicurvata sp. EGI_FJ10296 TaxID=3231908 RepID=UPI003456984E